MKNSLVSIITPCHNGEKYLHDYFEGVLSQKYRNIELIFVNDGSTDNTEKIAKEYSYEFLKAGMQFLYIFQNNSGQAAAINRGLSIFSGDFLMWLDSDDIMLPDNISSKIDFLTENRDVDFAISEIEFVDEKDKDIVIGCQKRIKSEKNENFFEDLIHGKNVVWGPGTVLVRREHLLKVIPSKKIYESQEGQNWQLMLPITYSGRCGYVERPLIKCVVHSDSHSRMERSPEKEMSRERNFIILCSETINMIPRMPEEEKEKWKREVRIFHNKKGLNIAVESRNKKQYKLFIRALKGDDCEILMRQRYFFFYIKKIIKIIKIIKRCFR